MVQAIISRLGSMLSEVAKEEVKRLLGVPYEITKLQRRRIRDSAVERWLKELRNDMYEADDILDNTSSWGLKKAHLLCI